ncbi:MAG: malate dehydrogenase [Dehalococcoidales bacterium]|jgi:malate dehydrogenase|nr:malate dehydrogenase [Dehalococcoidales bacterium]MDP6449111.1 malate dehydrogenase [Dehalococcoidales bacterium]MDP6577108.1 malate dehydrogenase [Dehalococcoidales bacterium]MDP6824663.1 malate dehydrogenase [Dehalococcoidales bacterium]MDP7415272.1 malate dehydrogenase [Dehalococcoidales bacterium]
MRSKISIIGAGSVGATCAQRIAEKGYADVVLVDIIPGLPQGKALDMMESAPVLGFDSHIVGTNGYEETVGSDVVIVTSGLARKPGMTRDELLLANAKIITEVTRNAVKYSPDGIILVVTNPVDTMTYLVLNASSFPPSRVFGLSGVLDSARLSSFIAAELGVSVADVFTCVIGEHGKNMMIIPRLCTVGSIPITRLLQPEAIDRLVARTVNGGAEIVDLLKTGSAFYAPSAAVAQMAEAVVLDKKQVLPCAVYLQREYGIKDTVISVPVKLGKAGVEEIIELELTAGEKKQLTGSAEAVRELIKTVKPDSKGDGVTR